MGPDEQTIPEGQETAAPVPPEAPESVPPAAPEGAAEWAAAEEPATDEAGEAVPEEPAPEDEAARYLELAKRTQADFENYRKRMVREQKLAGDRGATKVVKELLPALDHLELALKAAEGHEEIIRGFAMVRDELVAGLNRAGVEAFSPEGEAFDPSEHEAMAQAPIDGAESGTVVQVYQRGYRLGGAVLRPARVVVAQ